MSPENPDSIPAKLVEVIIKPDSPEMKVQSLLKSRRIQKRFFTIGRRSSRPTALADGGLPDHLVAESYPYTISREQCEIERLPTGVIVRDLGSRMGTVVNGTRISSMSEKDEEVTLGLGEHELILGHRDGVIRFQLTVTSPAPQST